MANNIYHITQVQPTAGMTLEQKQALANLTDGLLTYYMDQEYFPSLDTCSVWVYQTPHNQKLCLISIVLSHDEDISEYTGEYDLRKNAKDFAIGMAQRMGDSNPNPEVKITYQSIGRTDYEDKTYFAYIAILFNV